MIKQYSRKSNIHWFSFSNQRFKAAAMSFPSSTEQQKKANWTQTQRW